jgi:hypothetical protein
MSLNLVLIKLQCVKFQDDFALSLVDVFMEKVSENTDICCKLQQA